MRAKLLIGMALSVVLVACEPVEQDEIAGAVETAAERPADMDRAGADREGIIDRGPDTHLLFTPDAVEWADAPPSLEPGAQAAVLEGNPAEAGVFTMRLRLPDGFQIAPHSHPNVERVTVISGTFLLGSGEELNEEEAERLEAGSYTSVPPGTNHFAIAEGETVLQLTSVGPWEINYVNAEDDPRQAQD